MLSAFGEPEVGLVGGVAREAVSGTPVANAQVVAHNIKKGADQTTVTSSEGVFAFTNLEPGQYEVAATKNGFAKASARIEVIARQVARVDLPLDIRQRRAA